MIVIMDHGLCTGERGYGGRRGLVVLEVSMKLKNDNSRNTATIPTALSIGIDWF